MKLKNYFFTAVLTMMFAACSVNEDNPSGDIPVPTESYETVLNYFKEINAIKLLADFLNSEADDLRIANIDGGSAPNTIATSAEATMVVPNGQKELFTEHFNAYMAKAKQQYAETDPSMQIFTFGPNVYDAHTINEHVEIGSIRHTWEYTLELLKNIY